MGECYSEISTPAAEQLNIQQERESTLFLKAIRQQCEGKRSDRRHQKSEISSVRTRRFSERPTFHKDHRDQLNEQRYSVI